MPPLVDRTGVISSRSRSAAQRYRQVCGDGILQMQCFCLANVVFCNSATMQSIHWGFPSVSSLEVNANPISGLSTREHVVATKFAKGLTYREIGEALFISPMTVRTHLSVIYQKLGVHSKLELASLLAVQGEQTTAAAMPNGTDRTGPTIIAVLPFDNLGSDVRWARLADGLSADIIVDLSRYADLAVISRKTMLAFKGNCDTLLIGRKLNADYLLEGLQATEKQIRISVQLVDGVSGASLWAERYERPMDDLFAVQDSVSENVINVLASCGGKLAKLRLDVARRKPPTSLGAYDCYLLGVEQHNLYIPAANAEAIRLLSRAVELDPGLARAWMELGFAYSIQGSNAYCDNATEALERFRDCAEKALSLDPGDSIARQCVGDLCACDGDFGRAIEENNRALAIAPNDGDTLALVAGSRALVAGDPHEGYQLIQRALRINALAPAWYYSMLGRVTFVMDRYAECIAAFRRAPEMPSTLMFLAMAYATIGETAEVTKLNQRLAKEFPQFTPEAYITAYPVTNPIALAAIRQGAQRAGLN